MVSLRLARKRTQVPQPCATRGEDDGEQPPPRRAAVPRRLCRRWRRYDAPKKHNRNCTMLRIAMGTVVLALVAGPAATAREVVQFASEDSAGTVVVNTQERRLYLVLGDGTAIRYPVAVGRPGKQWVGTTQIARKHVKPAWSPPEEVRRDNPDLPAVIPGGYH